MINGKNTGLKRKILYVCNMKICVIGGANADITATCLNSYVPNDSNPGTIRLTPGGVARNIAHNLALLGDDVVFLTIFGGDTFGLFTADSCRRVKIDISLCDTAPVGVRSCFVSLNDQNGEMIGGVSDMDSVDGITPVWLATKLSKVGPVDAYVADANLPVETLAYLIDFADVPLYLDAVSSLKAPKIKKALRMSTRKSFFTLKCNSMEAALFNRTRGAERMFCSNGEAGVTVKVKQKETHFEAAPCKVVNAIGAGDAMMAGIVHAGPQASIEEAAAIGLRCAKITVESPDTVNPRLKELYEQLS